MQGVFLPDSLVSDGFGGISTPSMSASQSQSGTRPGSPSRLVLEGGCDRSADAGGTPSSSSTTSFNGLDLSAFLQSGFSSTESSNILQPGERGPAMDFNDLNMFSKRDGLGQDGSSSGTQHQQQHNQHHQGHSQSGQTTGNASNPNAVNLEALQQLLSMQMSMQYSQPQQTQQGALDGSSAQVQTHNHLQANIQSLGSGASGSGGSAGENSPAATLIFEQQLRVQQLQQLQQLQNQIFQQQLELLNGQNGAFDGSTSPLSLPNAGQFHGLPTPLNSTELRPQTHVSFVTPTYIQPQAPSYPQFSTPGVSNSQNSSSHASHSQPQIPLGSSSAPAHLAFASHNPLGMGDMELELSPITSPWLAPVQYQQQGEQQLQPQQTRLQSQQQSNTSPAERNMGEVAGRSSGRHAAGGKKKAKRGASDSGEEGMGGAGTAPHARKRQSAGRLGLSGASVPGEGTSNSSGKRGSNARGSASVGSTPTFLGRGRRNSEAVADTPSPVDLSMPPPKSTVSGIGATGRSNHQSLSPSENSIPDASPALAPVTPASIMNLGRLGLGSGLSPPLSASDQQDPLSKLLSQPNSSSASNSKGKSKASKSGSASRPTIRRASTSTAHCPSSNQQHQEGQPKSQNQTQSSTPSLKPLLPDGVPASSASALASSPNYTHHLSGASSSLNLLPSTPLPPPLPAVRKTSHKAAEQKRRDSLKTSFDSLRCLLPPLVLPNDEHYSGEAPLPGALPPRGPPKGGEGGANRMASKLQLLRAGNEYIGVLKGRVERRDSFIEELKKEVETLRMLVRQSSPLACSGGAGIREGEGEDEGEEDDPVERVLGSLNVKMVALDLDLDACEENMGSAGQMRLRSETIAEGEEGEADDEDV